MIFAGVMLSKFRTTIMDKIFETNLYFILNGAPRERFNIWFLVNLCQYFGKKSEH